MWSLLTLLACAPRSASDSGDTGGDTDQGGHDPIAWLADYWTPTAEACQVPDPFISPYLWDPFYDAPCQYALAADLKMDPASFAADSGGGTSWEGLMRGTFYLLGRDLGTVAELRQLSDDTDTWAIREPFITQIEAVADAMDEDDVRPALYNLVMSTILHTTHLSDSSAQAIFMRSTRTLRFRASGNPDLTAILLVHEATHGWQDVGHIECPEGTVINGWDYSGEKQCDPDWGGAYGFQVAAARLMYNGVPEDAPDADTWYAGAQQGMDTGAAHILAD